MGGPKVQPSLFRYPLATQRFVFFSSIVSLGAIGVVLWTSPSSSVFAVGVLLCLVAGALYVNLDIHLSEVRVDDEGVAQRSVLGTRVLRWTEVEEFLSFSRLLVLRGPRGGTQIRLFRGDFGFSLEPFSHMRDLILAKVQPLLWEKWASKEARRQCSYPYPPISPLQAVGYLVAVSLTTMFFVIAPLQGDVFGLEQAVFLAASLLALGVFLFRDCRKTRRRIVLREDGFQESNGGTTLLRWEEITDVLVKEPVFGSGSFVVSGKQGKVTIPMRMRGCGELFFLLSTLGKPRITYGHEL
jgi:hypothetical protein